MHPVWVVQNDGIGESAKIIDAVTKLGEPFMTFSSSDEVESWCGTNVIPYGSTGLVKIGIDRKWKHLFYDPESFNCKAWMNNHPKMLNGLGFVMQVWELRGGNFDWYSDYFIRPTGDLKEFDGRCMSYDELSAWIDRISVGDCDVTLSTEILIAEVENIQMEWRYFIVGEKIVSGSSYRRNDRQYLKRETDEDVIEEAQRLADMWLPHPCCCMDLALSDGELFVVEFNTLNASGLYDCDVERIVEAVSWYAGC